MSLLHQFTPPPGQRFNTWSHLLGLAVSVSWGLHLLASCFARCDRTSTTGIAVFVVAAIWLFVASVLCHASSGRQHELWARADHAATFLLIAGSYTPFATIQPRVDENVVVLAVIWGAALLQCGRQLLGRGLSAPPLTAYLAQGWFSVVSAAPAAMRLSPAGLPLLLAGALMYSIGTVFYRNKNGWAHAHGTWHLFVVSGLAAHAAAVSRLLPH